MVSLRIQGCRSLGSPFCFAFVNHLRKFGMMKAKTMREEQIPFDFDKTPPKAAEEPELHERDECPACGNIIESDSPGCAQCSRNKAKLAWQRKKRETENDGE